MPTNRVIQVSTPNGPFELVERELGAHEYIDTEKVAAEDGLRRLGGADLVLAAAPYAAAIASSLGDLKVRRKLLVVAATFEPTQTSAFPLLSGKSIAGWPSGVAIDSEEAMTFSALSNVRPRTETFGLDQANEAFERMMENRVRFRAVLVPAHIHKA
jgi:propanol-preferring alcohol dehydrogenase